jgi:hypothetical protein
MTTLTVAPSQAIHFLLRAAVLAAAFLLTGCATHYLDGAVKDTPASAYVRAGAPHPVQVVFEFQTKGAANSRATDLVKPMVMESVRAASLFSEVGDKPAAGAGLMSVQINNVALTDDAFSKGFMTGLTFGLAGSTVTDGYLCTVSYTAPGASVAVIKTSKHALHTALGSAGAPPGGVKVNSIDEGVRGMVRQIMGVALSELSRDPQFK